MSSMALSASAQRKLEFTCLFNFNHHVEMMAAFNCLTKCFNNSVAP